MRTFLKTSTGLLLSLFFFGFVGYILNVVKFIRADFKAPYKVEIIRGISLIPPIGAVTGWIKIEDK